MDASTIVAIVAAGIALVAAGFAWWQALSAKRQADAAEASTEAVHRQAEAAERSLALAKEQWDDEQRDRDALGLAQARMVLLDVEYSGALKLTITNYDGHPVFQLGLDNVVAVDAPMLPWKYNRRVIGADRIRDVVEPSDNAEFWVEFENPDGSLNRNPSDSYEIMFSYTDWLGQRWQRNAGDDPERVSESAGSD